ncbi:hypothetical protein ACGFNV_41650 [Streptomyces sp. NPDC048751]|uniref:hypothetical protein n=1 Tax=Streptomyces sp. NPDC048751 TaxID=3365591 RepID=UPI003721B1D0
MSGDKNKSDSYQAARQDATQQNTGVDDAMNKAAVISPAAPGSPGGFGKTSFEGYDLNEMIDIVESASPETLESAATALVDARDAINEAAEELSRNLGNVDWQGEAHTAFYTWGTNLATTALALANYADEVGTQVMAASSGLASVRKSMPPRDTRSAPKSIDEIPETKRIDSNEEYAAAVTAENHRQEAINQMYRLASFYTVSSGMMQLAEEPVFPKMPAAGVPEPTGGYKVEPPGGQATNPVAHTRGSEIVGPHSTHAPTERAQSDVSLPSARELVDPPTLPDRHVGTEIDSVGTLPPQETVKPTTITPPPTAGQGGTPPGTIPPFAPVAVPTTPRGLAGRTSGFGGVPGSKLPASAQGRAGGIPGGTSAGRTGTGPIGQAGRALAPGQAGGRASGPTGRGVVGGVPKAEGQAAAGRASGVRGPVTGMGTENSGRQSAGRTGAGRSTDGVVGGKPVTGATSTAKGSKLPRGTVVGAEGGPTSRGVSERRGGAQRGVIGAPGSTTGAGQTPRRAVGSPDGVVGTPKGRATGARNSRPDAARGSAANQSPRETRARRDQRRDDASATD